ncbi:hypothetical protein G7072_09980 [Nocardioides sp. HDW12B]|uniref:DUF6167 family protein n=1 Tax=Nocardioides sp. HDW12B TaxID=2714939 RepID=UPI001407436F|nr:DUF6167 family protein [Nocardioides sp. HDW12B]QIK66627.1 hypothetical protein G7072_09980 [Nocardioides sp. HDW12B]
MRRGLWFLAGTAAGVWTSVRARRAAESMTVDGLQDRLQGLAAGARVLRDEVAAGRAEKETDVRARLSLVSDESTEPTGSTSGETPGITTGKVDD